MNETTLRLILIIQSAGLVVTVSMFATALLAARKAKRDLEGAKKKAEGFARELKKFTQALADL